MKKQRVEVRDVKSVEKVAQLLWNTANEFSMGSHILGESKKIYSLDESTTSRFPDSGDSGYLLLIISLELYLKLLHLIDKKMLVYGHDQGMIYKLLERKTQDNILNEYNNIPNNTQLSKNDIIGKLEHAGNNYLKVRYFFDSYATMDDFEIDKRIHDFDVAPDHTEQNSDIIYDHQFLVAIHSIIEQLALDKLQISSLNSSSADLGDEEK